MPKVSLIVPVYNTEIYLKKCINSLINQSLKDIEIIIINDGSTDNSDKIIKEYNDKRIMYISKKNEGIGKTRNLGIDKSKGEYIAFVDSDDYLDSHFCKKMYEKAVKDECDIVICNFYEDKGFIQERMYINFKNTNLKHTPELINNINLGPCNKLYKKELLKNKNIRFIENKKYEDAPFVTKALINAQKIGKVEESLTYYVIHNESETTVRDKRIFDIFPITDIIVQDLKKANHPHESIVNIAVMILADYTIQQKYIRNFKMRNKFIDIAFDYLNELDKNWRKCDYLKSFPKHKRVIKIHKLLTKLYCTIYKK